MTSKIKKLVVRSMRQIRTGQKWMGADGLINLESSALLILFFMLFFNALFAIIFTFLIILGKCVFDSTRGRTNEKHDFICACIGIVLGLILAHAKYIGC